MLYRASDYSGNVLAYKEVVFISNDNERFEVMTDSNGWVGVSLTYDEIEDIGVKVYREDLSDPDQYLDEDEDYFLLKGEKRRPNGAKTTNVGGAIYFEIDRL